MGHPMLLVADQAGTVDPSFQAAYNQVVNTFGAQGLVSPSLPCNLNTLLPNSRGLFLTWDETNGSVPEFRGSEGRGAVLQQQVVLLLPSCLVSFGKLINRQVVPLFWVYPLSSQKDLGNGAYELELPNGKLFWAPGMTNPTTMNTSTTVNGSR
jgi:hypothetical protein